jgi:hypothetical protein
VFVRFKEILEVTGILFDKKVGNAKLDIEGKNVGGDNGIEGGVRAGDIGSSGCRRFRMFFVRLFMLLSDC